MVPLAVACSNSRRDFNDQRNSEADRQLVFDAVLDAVVGDRRGGQLGLVPDGPLGRNRHLFGFVNDRRVEWPVHQIGLAICPEGVGNRLPVLCLHEMLYRSRRNLTTKASGASGTGGCVRHAS